MRSILFAVALLLAISTDILAQPCLVYQKEIEQYFLNYITSGQINLPAVERTRNLCPQTNSRIELVYAYLLAKDALQDEGLDENEAYLRATYYYDECARHFSSLDVLGGERFSDLFYQKAEGMEVALATMAYNLGYRRENRYYGQVEGQTVEEWLRNAAVSDPYGSSDQSRGMGQKQADRIVFQKKYYRDGIYVNMPPTEPKPEYDLYGEPYGYISNVFDLGPISYLKWRNGYIRKHSFAFNSTEEDYTGSSSRFDETNQPTRGSSGSISSRLPGDRLFPPAQPVGEIADLPQPATSELHAWVNLLDRGGLRMEPGETAAVVKNLRFGEQLYRVSGDRVVSRGEDRYVRVKTRDGSTGWIKEESLVYKGIIAVILRDTRGIQEINARLDRNAVILKGGELVVIEDYQNGAAKIIGRNGTKRAWVSDLTTLSVSDNDVRIGIYLFEALGYASAQDRKYKLEDIMRLPGYPNSELKYVVEKLIGYSR